MTECSSGKRGYVSHDAAMRGARHSMAKQKKLKVKVVLRVYRCDECHCWHMTSVQRLLPLREERFQKARQDFR